MMKAGVGVFVAVVLAGFNPLARGQGAGAKPAFPFPVAENPHLPAQTGGAVFRELDDPSTGNRWLLARDAVHPEGPGRWQLVAARKAGDKTAATLTGASLAAQAVDATALPVIHAGDEVSVAEHSAVIDATLQGVALGSAAAGAEFRARLKIGGKVIDAVALESGHAVFAAQKGMWR